MEDSKSKEKIQTVHLKANDARQLNPTEIVMHNARVLVNAPEEEQAKLVGAEFRRLKERMITADPTYKFSEDTAAMLEAQIILVTLSTAIEYWMAKLRQDRIKVYTADQMPKA